MHNSLTWLMHLSVFPPIPLQNLMQHTCALHLHKAIRTSGLKFLEWFLTSMTYYHHLRILSDKNHSHLWKAKMPSMMLSDSYWPTQYDWEPLDLPTPPQMFHHIANMCLRGSWSLQHHCFRHPMCGDSINLAHSMCVVQAWMICPSTSLLVFRLERARAYYYEHINSHVQLYCIAVLVLS